MSIPLETLLDNISPLPYELRTLEGERARAIVSGDDLVADCYATCTENLGLPGDYKSNAAYLKHAANTMPALVRAVRRLLDELTASRHQLSPALAVDLVEAYNAANEAAVST